MSVFQPWKAKRGSWCIKGAPSVRRQCGVLFLAGTLFLCFFLTSLSPLTVFAAPKKSKKAQREPGAAKASEKSAGGVKVIPELGEKTSKLIEEGKSPSEKVVWVTKNPIVRAYEADGSRLILAEIQVLVSPESSWKLESKNLQPNVATTNLGTSYTFFMKLNGPSTKFSASFKSKKGTKHNQKLVVEFPEYAAFLAQEGKKADQPSVTYPPPSTPYGDSVVAIRPELGVSNLTYSEGSRVSFSSWNLTAKLSVRVKLSEGWDTEVNGYTNALMAIRSPSDTPTVRLLAANLRFGYHFPVFSESFSMGIHGGAYFVTMLGTGSTFGFSNLLLPQIFPTFQYKVNDGIWVNLFLKYVPTGSTFSYSSQEREITVGAGVTYWTWGRVALSSSLYWGNLRVYFNSLSGLITLTNWGVNQGIIISF